VPVLLPQKSGENLGSLLRLLQNLSLSPEWGVGTDAADLAIAAMLGAWSEKSDADRAVVEGVSGKAYGEWIGKMREIALRPGAPPNSAGWRPGSLWRATKDGIR